MIDDLLTTGTRHDHVLEQDNLPVAGPRLSMPSCGVFLTRTSTLKRSWKKLSEGVVKFLSSSTIKIVGFFINPLLLTGPRSLGHQPCGVFLVMYPSFLLKPINSKNRGNMPSFFTFVGLLDKNQQVHRFCDASGTGAMPASMMSCSSLKSPLSAELAWIVLTPPGWLGVPGFDQRMRFLYRHLPDNDPVRPHAHRVKRSNHSCLSWGKNAWSRIFDIAFKAPGCPQ